MNNETILRNIREILLSEWDPLGVSGNRRLSDEYDSYIPEIARLIQTKADTSEIDQHLAKIEKTLGINPPAGNRSRAARRLADCRT